MIFSDRLKAVGGIDPAHWAIEQDGAQYSWADLVSASDGIEAAARQGGLAADACICVVVRNDIAAAVGILGVLIAGRPVVYVNGLHSEGKRLDEVRDIRPAMLLGAGGDLTAAMLAALGEYGGLAATIDADLAVSLLPEAAKLGAGPFFAPAPGTAVIMRTSGTTGAPKLISLSRDMVERGMREGTRGQGATNTLPERIPSSPTLLFAPLYHASGTFGLLLSIFEARPVVLFEKFKLDTLRSALRRYPVRFLSMPPAVLRMVPDSDLDADDLKSIIAVRAGTAPLDPSMQAAFEARFGVPVLTTYGATEFMGALARWTIADHRSFGEAKRGSVGRVSPGVDLRLVDVDSGEPVGVGAVGLLEVKGSRVGSRDWVRTNDLGRLDEDGFLWIAGRADDAIIRGGFKVLADGVASVLERHAGVLEASVIGLPDHRLGEVPVAAVEPRENVPPPTPEELTEFARAHLAPYQVPARILVVPKLPRTVSLKVSRPGVRALFENVPD